MPILLVSWLKRGKRIVFKGQAHIFYRRKPMQSKGLSEKTVQLCKMFIYFQHLCPATTGILLVEVNIQLSIMSLYIFSHVL